MMKFLIAAIAASALLISSYADAACTQVSGTAQATDGACTQSAIGLCASGTFSGSINGTYVGAFQSLTPAPTLAQPLRLSFTITSTITTSTGTLYQTETGYIVENDVFGSAACIAACALLSSPDICLAGCVATYGRTTFVQNMTPYEGTGSYSSIVDGLIVATGYGEYTSGVSYGNYSGEICDTPQ